MKNILCVFIIALSITSCTDSEEIFKVNFDEISHSSGVSGMHIIITPQGEGLNDLLLSDDIKVTFAENEARVVLKDINANEIVVEVPSGNLGEVDVLVTASSIDVSSSLKFNYLPKPVIDRLENHLLLKEGKTIDIYGQNLDSPISGLEMSFIHSEFPSYTLDYEVITQTDDHIRVKVLNDTKATGGLCYFFSFKLKDNLRDANYGYADNILAQSSSKACYAVTFEISPSMGKPGDEFVVIFRNGRRENNDLFFNGTKLSHKWVWPIGSGDHEIGYDIPQLEPGQYEMYSENPIEGVLIPLNVDYFTIL